MSGNPASNGVDVPAPLLRIPPRLRHHIYLFLGPESSNTPPITFYLQRRDHLLGDTAKTGPGQAESSPHAFRGLLLSCQVLYAETVALLYSTNHFVIHYNGLGSLAPLHALTATALSFLSSLKIVLNEASCHTRVEGYVNMDCCTPPAECHLHWSFSSHTHQRPLLASTPASERKARSNNLLEAAQALLSEWHAAACHLSSSITPGNLALGLVCDIDPRHEHAIRLAASVVAPLRLLPLLKGCHVRLAKTPDPQLSQLAQQSALEARGQVSLPRPKSADATAFLTLPRELRLRILELTDLITPTKEVWWCRQDARYAWSDLLADYLCHNSNFDPHCFSECWYRAFYLYRAGLPGMPFGCFCRRRHTAASTTCSCWLPPTPMFLVCRVICRDAQLVFFSANRFIIHDLSLVPWAPNGHSFEPAFTDQDAKVRARSKYPFQRLAASHFLREAVPAHCVGYLRFVDLVFPPYFAATWPQYEHPAMQDWRETVRWLQERMNGPVLTLRVVAVEFGVPGPGQDPEFITVAEGDAIDKGYMTILHPLAQLAKGPNYLGRFYADLKFPWHWTDSAMPWLERGRWAEVGRRGVKKRAERLVLGDRYNSQYANGTDEPEISLWQHVFNEQSWIRRPLPSAFSR
ncbi:hypothetical protein C8A05DRAFT_18410 [Staphylotrichum tortipilum]|uniref:F-box domain-containing protein n=1 Tax=Staphylotrichum tortipilum TaxID=2831512 RepID=A0AAN6MFQ1_9PEZI|nr:hypothetical protein C8A05DRAFT_18410 [Staphylotrichum longicolle]